MYRLSAYYAHKALLTVPKAIFESYLFIGIIYGCVKFSAGFATYVGMAAVSTVASLLAVAYGMYAMYGRTYHYIIIVRLALSAQSECSRLNKCFKQCFMLCSDGIANEFCFALPPRSPTSKIAHRELTNNEQQERHTKCCELQTGNSINYNTLQILKNAKRIF